MISALRKFTATSQTFWGCDETDTGGVLGVRVDDVDYAGDTLAAATDYTGLVTATGLSEGQHTYQMTLDGEPVGETYTFTSGDRSSDDITIVFMGDTNHKVGEAFQAVLDREQSLAMIAGLELFYMDGGLHDSGSPPSDENDYLSSEDKTHASYIALRDWARGVYRLVYANDDGMVAAMNAVPLLSQPGNHDLGSGLEGHVPGMCRYDGLQQAAAEYAMHGMPYDTAGVDSEPDPVFYWAQRIGDVEIISTDGVTYSWPLARAALHGTSATGNNAGEDLQVDWIKAKIEASTASVIIIFHANVTQNRVEVTEWTDLMAWLDARDETIIFVTGNVHHFYAKINAEQMDTNPSAEFGCSASAAVTSATNAFRDANDTYLASDCWDNGTTLTATATVPAEVGPQNITVADSSIFRVGKRAIFGNNLENKVISAIHDATTITISTRLAAEKADGSPVYAANFTYYTDHDNGNSDLRWANYLRVTRKHNGSRYDSNPHTLIESVGTFTGRIRFRCWIRDGERTPRLFTSYGKATVGL